MPKPLQVFPAFQRWNRVQQRFQVQPAAGTLVEAGIGLAQQDLVPVNDERRSAYPSQGVVACF